jgi:hypothetical protein
LAPVDNRELLDRPPRTRYEKKEDTEVKATEAGAEAKPEVPEKPKEPEVVYDSLSNYYQTVGMKKTQPGEVQAGPIAKDEKKLEKFTNKNEKVFIKKEAEGSYHKKAKKTGAYIQGASELDDLVQSI